MELEVDNQLTHGQIQSLLDKNVSAPNSAQTLQNWTEKIDLNSQTLEVYSNESLLTENDTDRFNILSASDQVNSATNLIVLSEANLAKLDPAHLIVIPNRYQGDQSSPNFRYFLNMMPEIGITACPHCNKVFPFASKIKIDAFPLSLVLLQRRV